MGSGKHPRKLKIRPRKIRVLKDGIAESVTVLADDFRMFVYFGFLGVKVVKECGCGVVAFLWIYR